MDKDRRQPLGGIKKETYVSSTTDPKTHAEMTFDLIAGLAADLCFKIEAIHNDVFKIKEHCSCRIKECTDQFIKKEDGISFLKRAHKKIPLTWPGLVAFILATGMLIGLGIIEINTGFKLFRLIMAAIQ